MDRREGDTESQDHRITGSQKLCKVGGQPEGSLLKGFVCLAKAEPRVVLTKNPVVRPVKGRWGDGSHSYIINKQESKPKRDVEVDGWMRGGEGRGRTS